MRMILLLFLPTVSIALFKHNIETDQYALLAFKSHVFDPSDTLTKNWTTRFSVCSWSGVTCSSRHHRVVALDVSLLGLQGSIAPEIGNLSFLNSLDLSHNNFHGNLPQEVIHLRRLKYINIAVNEFSGAVPSWFGSLPNLQYLYLSNNSFTGPIPISLFNASKLEELYLSINELEGNIPEEIGYLGSLYIMNMQLNSLTGNLPMNICSKLPELQYLLLGGNYISGQIESRFDNCSELQILELNTNNFSGPIPRDIGNLTNLKGMYFGENYFTGGIPAEIGNLPNLEMLRFEFNTLTGVIPKEIGNLQKLESLALTSNALSGQILGTILNMSFLTDIQLSMNNCFGSLPPAIGYMLPKLEATNGFSESNLHAVGGYGSVYKGVLRDGTILAIKVFNLQLEGAFKSFDMECEVLRNLRHRNLVKVISSCSNPEFKALVLEYMSNGSLEKWLYSHNYFLNFLQRLDIMIDVASALDYLHHGYSSPVIHCDLKPSNVLIDECMTGRLSDFGISKFFDGGESTVQTKTLATIGYIAPEYGSQGIVSTSCDVYSFGILLMETFSRKKPTDEMFGEDWGLKEWVADLLQCSATEFIDPNLITLEDQNSTRKVQAILPIMKLSLRCTKKLPEERISVIDALEELKKIKSFFLSK